MAAPDVTAAEVDDVAAKMGVVDVTTLSLKALKELIVSAGLSHADCLEKSELVARAREAQRVRAERAREVRWVTCPLCSKQFAAATEEECTAHMAECTGFAARHGGVGSDPAG